MRTRQRQLAAIAQVDRLASASNGQAWLRGGWAMDFYLGRVTRPHTDVDMFVESSIHRQVVAELINFGWQLDPRLPVEQQTDLSLAGVELSLNPVREKHGRPIVGPGPWQGEAFPADMLERAGRARLEGVEASFISPMSQIEFKLMTRTWQPGVPFRPKDETDVALLCHHMFHGQTDRAHAPDA